MACAAYPDRNPSPNALTPRRAAAGIRVAADEAALACLNPDPNPDRDPDPNPDPDPSPSPNPDPNPDPDPNPTLPTLTLTLTRPLDSFLDFYVSPNTHLARWLGLGLALRSCLG